MGRWKKDETQYTVRLNHDERRGCIAIIPKPILEELSQPDQITFKMSKRGILVETGDYTDDH